MDRTLGLALNRYPEIPATLRADPKGNTAVNFITVGLANLFHHYYLDSFGRVPPQPDPVQFEHVKFLLPCSDFRFQGSGLGISPAIKRSRSTELGQAFCRWFLHDHLNITYFAHMEHVLNRQMHRPFASCRIERVASGDTPDYLCANDSTKVFLAEAKGRYSAVSFNSKEFGSWRAQFSRVMFFDSGGVARSLKGHIVATRFATEEGSSRVRSGIWAEDPDSPGNGFADEGHLAELGRAVISSHYSNLAEKIAQPVLANALATGVPLPDELRVLGVAWRVTAGPLAGRRFVGGYYSPGPNAQIIQDTAGKTMLERLDPLRLDGPNITFFGIEENILKKVVHLARSGPRSHVRIPVFEETDFFYSGFSVLRDGSALGPLEWFAPEERVIL